MDVSNWVFLNSYNGSDILRRLVGGKWRNNLPEVLEHFLKKVFERSRQINSAQSSTTQAIFIEVHSDMLYIGEFPKNGAPPVFTPSYFGSFLIFWDQMFIRIHWDDQKIILAMIHCYLKWREHVSWKVLYGDNPLLVDGFSKLCSTKTALLAICWFISNWSHSNCYKKIHESFGTKYSRMDQVKFVKDSL